jgi:hypothetical protein
MSDKDSSHPDNLWFIRAEYREGEVRDARLLEYTYRDPRDPRLMPDLDPDKWTPPPPLLLSECPAWFAERLMMLSVLQSGADITRSIEGVGSKLLYGVYYISVTK